jgi:uncharacterized protein (DUF1330 family)
VPGWFGTVPPRSKRAFLTKKPNIEKLLLPPALSGGSRHNSDIVKPTRLTHLRHCAGPANGIRTGCSDEAAAHQLYLSRFARRYCELWKRRGGCNCENKVHIDLAILAGVGIGAAAVQPLHAQTKPPACAVVELEVQNPRRRNFCPLLQWSSQKSGGKFLARPGIANASDGKTPNRVALIAFYSLDKALGAITPNSHPTTNLPPGPPTTGAMGQPSCC